MSLIDQLTEKRNASAAALPAEIHTTMQNATQLLKGNDIGKGFERTMDSIMSWFKPKSSLKTVHRKTNKKGYVGKTKDEFNTFNNQKKIDLILDKISKSGYESLTAEEKEFLFRSGKN